MTQSSSTVLCVILNWDGGATTQQCVQSVLTSQDVRVTVLVIDNGSTDGSDTTLVDRFPSIVLVKNTKNLGVVCGFNQGIHHALEKKYQYVFFLNSDAVVAPNCIALLAATLSSEKKTGIVSPRILDSCKENRIWFDGGILNMFGDPIHQGFGKQCNVTSAEAIDEEHATGCAMLVRTDLFTEVGGFDERFFAYSEDADFCLRAKKHGWRIRHNPVAVVTHRPSSSVRANKGRWFRDYYVTRNKLLLMRQHMKGLRWFVFLSYFSLKYFLVPILYFAVTGQLKRITAVLSGLIDFIFKRFGERYA